VRDGGGIEPDVTVPAAGGSGEGGRGGRGVGSTRRSELEIQLLDQGTFGLVKQVFVLWYLVKKSARRSELEIQRLDELVY
jgi:hypothetical protein